MRFKILLGVIITLLYFTATAQAYFISPRVPFSPSEANVTYFLGNYVSNDTRLYSDKIYLDGTWIVMHPDNYTVNVTVEEINSTFQHYMIQNSSADINLSVNTSGWSADGTVESYSNDSAVSNTTVNSSGWVNVVFSDISDLTTTKFTMMLIVSIPVPIFIPLPRGLMIEEDNIRFNIQTGRIEVYLVI